MKLTLVVVAVVVIVVSGAAVVVVVSVVVVVVVTGVSSICGIKVNFSEFLFPQSYLYVTSFVILPTI